MINAFLQSQSFKADFKCLTLLEKMSFMSELEERIREMRTYEGKVGEKHPATKNEQKTQNQKKSEKAPKKSRSTKKWYVKGEKPKCKKTQAQRRKKSSRLYKTWRKKPKNTFPKSGHNEQWIYRWNDKKMEKNKINIACVQETKIRKNLDYRTQNGYKILSTAATSEKMGAPKVEWQS